MPLPRPLKVLLSLAAAVLPDLGLAEQPWWEGIDSVKVLAPGDPTAQDVVDKIASTQRDLKLEVFAGQFNDQRFAVLLLPGHHELEIEVGFYTAIIGAGAGPNDVTVSNVQSFDGPTGGALHNFWRSIEGVTVKANSTTWATSQGSPLRRVVFEGDLKLWDRDSSSGGFAADVLVKGVLRMGSQQQYFWRNSHLEAPVDCPGGWNYVWAGTRGAPRTSFAFKPNETGNLSKAPEGCQSTSIRTAPKKAEKPYLAVQDGVWAIHVPPFIGAPSIGVTSSFHAVEQRLDLSKDVFIARADKHRISDVNQGMARKRGVLFTPGIYEADEALMLKRPGFVVLGIGFPTLVSTFGKPAVVVADGLTNVRIAGLLLEAGTPVNYTTVTQPLFVWGVDPTFSAARGVVSDLFARAGAFKYERPFKPSCLVPQADVMMEINNGGIIIDNSWHWVADHDDCGPPGGPWPSDGALSRHGLIVNGDDVVAYCLMVEHHSGNGLVQWRGDKGQLFMFQSELPYHLSIFGQNGEAGYLVAPQVSSHRAVGVGVYLIGNRIHVDCAVRAPPAASFHGIVTATLGGEVDQFRSVLCSANVSFQSDWCAGPICHLDRIPLVL